MAYHAKSRAQTGRPHPNISTIFIGRSREDELECKHTPKSAEPSDLGRKMTSNNGKNQNKPRKMG